MSQSYQPVEASENPFEEMFSLASMGGKSSKFGLVGDLWRLLCCHSALALVATVLIMTAVLPPISHNSVYFQWDSVPVSVLLTVVLLAVAKRNHDRVMKTVIFMSITFHFTFRLFLLVGDGHEVIQDHGLKVLRISVSIAFLSLIILMLIRHLWTSRISGADSLWVASALYLMLALIFGQGYTLIYIMDHESFRIDPELDAVGEGHPAHHRFPIFLYYSTVVITTVGFGDITPLSRIARSLTWFEALTGQLYMVILMGRIVSMQLDFVKARSKKNKKKKALEAKAQSPDPSSVSLGRLGYLSSSFPEERAKSA